MFFSNGMDVKSTLFNYFYLILGGKKYKGGNTAFVRSVAPAMKVGHVVLLVGSFYIHLFDFVINIPWLCANQWICYIPFEDTDA